MFFNKCTLLNIPNMPLYKDLLTRSTEPDRYSYCPYKGMNDVLLNNKYVDKGSFEYSSMFDYMQDLDIRSIDKSLSNDDDLYSNLEGFSYLLEELDVGFVKRYLNQQLYGTQHHNASPLKSLVKFNKEAVPIIRDTETGEVYNPSDDYVDEETKLVVEESNKNNYLINKIPYLLKRLHEGSRKYHLNLLSMFINIDMSMTLDNIPFKKLKPSHVFRNVVYAMSLSNPDEISKSINLETANTNNHYRFVKDIVLGVYPDNIYFKAGMELIDIFKRLGYNLYEENALDFQYDYISRLFDSYLISNSEFLEGLLFERTDDVLFNCINILDLKYDINDSNVDFDVLEDSNLLVYTNDLTRIKRDASLKLSMKINNKDFDYLNVVNDVEGLFNKFIHHYNNVLKKDLDINSDKCINNIYDLVLDDFDVYCYSNNKPALFNLTKFVTGSSGSSKFKNIYAIFIKDGYFIRVDEYKNNLTVWSVYSIVNCIISGEFCIGKEILVLD